MSDKRFTPTPPRYDAVYYKGMKWLDGMASGEEEEMSDKPRRCSATYPPGDGLVVRCYRKSGHRSDHSARTYPNREGCVSSCSWPRKKKEGK